MRDSEPAIRSRMFAYGRIWWGLVFLWVFGLGMRHDAWKMVVVPLLGMAAMLIWAKNLRKQYPTFAPTLLIAATCFLGIFATYISAPTIYETFAQMIRGSELNFQLHHEPNLVPLQQALTDYVSQTGNADGKEILEGLNRLKAKHDAGTFGPEDQKEEDALFARAQGLAKRDLRLQRAVEQIAEVSLPEEKPTSAPSPANARSPQSGPGDAVPQKRIRTEAPRDISSPASYSGVANTTAGDPSIRKSVAANAVEATGIGAPLPTRRDCAINVGGDVGIEACCYRNSQTTIKCEGNFVNASPSPENIHLADLIEVHDNAGGYQRISLFAVRFGTNQQGTLYPGYPQEFEFEFRDPSGGVSTELMLSMAYYLNEMQPERTFVLSHVPVQPAK